MQLPGWGSVETVSRIHSFCEIAGIVALALLVGFEVLAYAYGHRREALEQLAHEQELRDITVPKLVEERVVYRNKPLPRGGFETRGEVRLQTVSPVPAVRGSATGKTIADVDVMPVGVVGVPVNRYHGFFFPVTGWNQVFNAFPGVFSIAVTTSEPDDLTIAWSLPKDLQR
jgi:hypothetical protein